MSRRLAAALFLLSSLAAYRATAADAVHGADRFKVMCAACHAVDPAQKKMGPHLKGVVGRKAASAEGFAYSAALKASGWTWDKEKLDAYLADPRKTAPGTTMMMGASSATDRADIIAYLETLK
jgi:cytochrome c